ncbi:MAG TPA: hypothetical protein VMR45_01540 [Patescibacteria group bacterium]|nr:hypothetical protein [Patescibacteria group bacterium]
MLWTNVTPEIVPASEILNPAYHIGCIATLPYGSDLNVVESGRVTPILSAPSEWSIDATIAIKHCHTEACLKIIGETPYGDDVPNTASLMRSRVNEVLGHGGFEAVDELTSTKSGNYANNTSLQMQSLAESLGTSGEGVLAVALNYHIGRVATHARAYGLKNMVYTAAEDVLALTGRLHKDDPFYEVFCAGVESSERILRVLSKIDPLGNMIFNPLTNSKGPRVVNVVPSPSGPIFVSTTAHARESSMPAGTGS